jgi:plasmid maintenance system antidote protein VapI
METKENERAIIVGTHLSSLLQQSGITITGLAHAIDMSVNHLRTIRLGKASISSRTAGKIADFFEIDVSQLFALKPIKLKGIKSSAIVKQFYEDNQENKHFFVVNKAENSLMYFLRTVLIKSNFLNVERDVKEIREHCKTVHKRTFNSKALSAQLVRLFQEGLLERIDKFGNGTVFTYRLK